MKVMDLKNASQHIPAIAAWHHREWSHLNPGRSEAQLVEQMSEYLSDSPIPRMFVCVDDGSVVGSSSLIASDMDTHQELGPWLANVYVDTSHRKRGIGIALVNAVVEYARSLNYEKIYLFTPGKEEFYKALGWSTMFREMYRGEMATVMEYRLSARTEPPH